jgi:hypothetical protein
VRDDLCAEAIRLGRHLLELSPDEPEVAGLLALMLLIDARRATRVDARGELVLLADQERARWDRGRIAEGQTLVRRCLERNRPGPYQIQGRDPGGPRRRPHRGRHRLAADRAPLRPAPGARADADRRAESRRRPR